MYVYLLDDAEIRAENIAGEAQRDMVRTFPPCKAANLERDICREIERDPSYNISGIDWTEDSSAIVVMAEVPCSGGHGGIMCEVMGYELNVPTGNIRKRLTAPQLQQEWQKSMAWKFRVPSPPHYE